MLTLAVVSCTQSYALSTIAIIMGLLGCSSEPGPNALDGTAAAVPPSAAGTMQSTATGRSLPGAAGAATAATGGGGAGGSAAGASAAPAGASGTGGIVGAAGAAGVAASGTGGILGSAGATGATASAGAGASGASGGSAAGSGGASASGFTLMPVGFPMYQDELTFPEAANPPANQSPEFTWTGVPAEAKSLALVFRDLGNGAVKWILWDIPPTVMRAPPNLSKTANPSEIPGSSQLGSLTNQGYAGPGSGARQYDFVLWALDVAKLPNTAGLTTAEIRMEILPVHEVATTEPILVRNTRNLR